MPIMMMKHAFGANCQIALLAENTQLAYQTAILQKIFLLKEGFIV